MFHASGHGSDGASRGSRHPAPCHLAWQRPRPTIFSDDDFALYRDLLAEHRATAGVEIWAWVLLPNHVHLILTPSDEDGLRATLSRTHRRYAGHVQEIRRQDAYSP
jgi:REP element-mobilizing transposase RayT